MDLLTWLLAILPTPSAGHDWDDRERGDVPGWVLITLMTAALVVAIWAVAGPRLLAILNAALDRVAVI